MIYLDNNATTKPDEQVVEAMARVMRTCWGNPSSVHRFGQEARREMELSRESVGELLGCQPREVIFTSGATEANNLAIRGVTELRAQKRVVVSTGAEHSAVREPMQSFARGGYELVKMPVGPDGLVHVEDVRRVLEERGDEVALVSIHWINNETGVIQPVEEIGALCRSHKVVFHTDGTQAVGKVDIKVAEKPIDLLSFSAHKFHGPKGVGGLYVHPSVRLRPQNLGGPHERERRGGTENLEGIVGLGVAAKLARAFVASDESRRIEALRNRLERGILEAIPTAVVNAADSPRIFNTTNIGFPPLEAEALLIMCSERGLYVSAGAACSSGSLEPSPVLLAMGLEDGVAHGSVRFSLSHETTEAEIEEALRIVPAVVEKVRASMPTV